MLLIMGLFVSLHSWCTGHLFILHLCMSTGEFIYDLFHKYPVYSGAIANLMLALEMM